jgi:uncharacterized protein YdaU (DUF1376 family)
MHYYKFNIADWHLATSHLSLQEEAVYFKLINFYYDTELPIPLETESVIRRLRLKGNGVIVKNVLHEFFVLEDDGWHHQRCDLEIAKYHSKAEVNREVGKLGGRPKKINDVDNPTITDMVSENNPQVTLTTNQEPLTTNQEPLTNRKTILADFKIPPCPHSEIINIYHEVLPELPRVVSWNKTREGYLKQRWRQMFIEFECKDTEDGLDWFRNDFFVFVKGSKFLTGKVVSKDRKPFLADLEWMIKPTNFTKIIERKYEN